MRGFGLVLARWGFSSWSNNLLLRNGGRNWSRRRRWQPGNTDWPNVEILPKAKGAVPNDVVHCEHLLRLAERSRKDVARCHTKSEGMDLIVRPELHQVTDNSNPASEPRVTVW